MKLTLPLLVICAALAVTNADEQPEVEPQPLDDGNVQVDLNSWPGSRWPRPPWYRRPSREQGTDAVETEADGGNQDARIQPNWWWRPRPWVRPRPRIMSDVDAEQQMLVERATANGQNTLLRATMPESANYDVVAERGWCVCCCRGCCNRRQSFEMEIRSSDDKLPEITVLGSQTELKLYGDKTELLRLYNSPVARSELVTRPLDPATPAQVSDALGGLQHAVVATLTDGRRFLVVKGNQKGEGSETIVILADHMTDDWTKVTTKDVSQSTLLDFIKAGGNSFDALKDNGTQAAARIMALP